MAFEKLAIYANPPNNILGTALFLNYILLALYLTTHIIISLYRQYRHTSSLYNGAAVKQLVILSLISFATLSYHMLKFLILSYFQWSLNKSMYKPDAGGGLWNWMLETSLFEDFAQELVRDGPSALATQAALLGTWFWGVWVGEKARGCGISKNEMGPYIALSQILPISFTVTLFLLKLQLQPISRETAKEQKDGRAQKTPSAADSASSQPPPPRAPLTITTLLFNALLLLLPSTRHAPSFIPAVLFTRLLLLLPYFGITGIANQEEWISTMLLSAGFMVANGSMLVKGPRIHDVGRALWKSGESVKTLFWDAALGLLIAGWVNWKGA